MVDDGGSTPPMKLPPGATMEDDEESKEPPAPPTWQQRADTALANFSKHKTYEDTRKESIAKGLPVDGFFNKGLDEAGTSISNIGRKAIAGSAGMFLHPLDSIKGTYELGKELVTTPLPIPGAVGEKAMQDYNANDQGPLAKRQKEFQEEYVRNPREAVENLSGDLLGMYVSGKLLDVAGKPLKPVVEAIKRYAKEKSAPGLINRLIRPMAADVKFGKDPAVGILDEKITGNSLDDIGDKVSDRLGEVGRELDKQASLPQNSSKVVDVSSSLKPIDDAMAEAVKGGNLPLWNKLLELREQLTNNWRPFKTKTGEWTLRKSGPRKLQMSPKEALAFKRMVGDKVKWTQDPLQGDVNQAAGGVYASLKNAVNQAIPGLKRLNERYSNLVGAAKAIQRRIPIEDRNAQWSLSDIALGATGHIPMAIARKAAASAPITTRVAGSLYEWGKKPASPSSIIPSVKSTVGGVSGILENHPTEDNTDVPESRPSRLINPNDRMEMELLAPKTSSVATPQELRNKAKQLNPSAQGQVSYNHNAVNPRTGHLIGSHDGTSWYDHQTGAQVT